jgi:hypothetical protein
MTTSLNLSKIKKKLNPEPDGQGLLRLQAATVSAIDADGTVDISLNGATVADVPTLGSARFVTGQAVQVLSYRGSLLVLGGSGKPSGQSVSAVGSTTSSTAAAVGTSFVNSLTGTGIHGVVFIAPPSGKVDVVGRAVGSNATASGFVLLDFEIRAGSTIGSGAVARASNNSTAGVFQSSTASQQATLVTGDVVSGLTPGTVYNAALTYAAGAAGQNLVYNRRHIKVLPA